MVSLSRDAAERAAGVMESLIVIGLGQNIAGLRLQGLDLIGNHLQLGFQADATPSGRPVRFRVQDRPARSRAPGGSPGRARCVGASMHHRFISLAVLSAMTYPAQTLIQGKIYFTKHKFCVKYRVLSGRCRPGKTEFGLRLTQTWYRFVLQDRVLKSVLSTTSLLLIRAVRAAVVTSSAWVSSIRSRSRVKRVCASIWTRVDHWVSVGAQLSDRARKLVDNYRKTAQA